MSTTLYGIWRFDKREVDGGAWVVADLAGEAMVLMDEEKAERWAAQYAVAYKVRCEVRPLNPPTVLEGAAEELRAGYVEYLRSLIARAEGETP